MPVIEIITILTAISVFCFVLGITTSMHSQTQIGASRKSVFLNWQRNLFSAIFRNKTGEEVAKKIGVDTRKRNLDYKILRKTPDYEKTVVYILIGIFLTVIFLFLGIITNHPALIIFGVCAATPFVFLPLSSLKSNAKKKRTKMADELPRFLDMLYTALVLDLPIDRAIQLTADHLQNTEIGKEFQYSLAEARLKNENWTEALYNLQRSAGINELSDFILDVSTAYKNGTSIKDAVARKSADIKETNILSMKERASRLTNTILFPILIFKILPLLAILGIPIVEELNNTGFSIF